MRILYLLTLAFVCFTASSEVTVSELKNKAPERMLYIGNSYLYYNDSLHNHVRRMLNEFYETEISTTEYKLVTISGSRSWHHNIDHSLNHKNLGVSEPFQLVIFQGGSGETDTVRERRIFAREVSEMVKKIHATGAEAALYMIHAFAEPHEKTNPQMIKDIQRMYVDAGNRNNAMVFPVGIAFENAFSKQPSIQLHKKFDGSHPSMLGTYLAACVVFASITHISPMKVDYSYYGRVDDQDKKFLQQIAHDTVEEFFNIKL